PVPPLLQPMAPHRPARHGRAGGGPGVASRTASLTLLRGRRAGPDDPPRAGGPKRPRYRSRNNIMPAVLIPPMRTPPRAGAEVLGAPGASDVTSCSSICSLTRPWFARLLGLWPGVCQVSSVPLAAIGLAGARWPAGTAGLGRMGESSPAAGCAPLGVPDPASRAMP